jgi:hypothetical protein
VNPYTWVGAALGTTDATALAARLTAWHDATVTHERALQQGRADAVCDDDCPHAEAGTLWLEALDVFGSRADDLGFLRSQAMQSNASRRALKPAV